jgi:type IV pilus assembly protein PilM
MLPNGGADLTGSLVDRLGVRPDRADELKRRIGLIADPDDPEAGVVAAVSAESAQDIVQAVRSTIAFYEHAHPETAVDGVVLSGGGSMLRGLADQLADATALPVTVGRVDGAFSIGSHVDEASFLAAGASPTVALGLTMRSAA